jgi:hypothetical protein
MASDAAVAVVILIFTIYTSYVIYTSGKYKIILNDFSKPVFWVILAVIIFIIMFVKDKKDEQGRTKRSVHHAILAGISAYFGHLDLPMAAFFLGGLFVYFAHPAGLEFQQLGKLAQ